MTTEMDDSGIVTVSQVDKLLSASKGLRLKSASREDKYKWLENVLKRFAFFSLGRRERGLLRQYMEQMSGISTSQLTRLISRQLFTGGIKAAWGRRNKFPITYTREDLELLAETDNLHGRLSGPATKYILERESDYGDVRYKRISGVSASHIYNLRKQAAYREKALTVSRTKSVQNSIGIRRKPKTGGRPGHLRVDTVHQGDLNGVKGVYHINLVDEVTQWEILVSLGDINEATMKEAIQEALDGFPFNIQGFHSDNGGEFLNTKVAELLNAELIKQSKSRSGRCNDNALVEGKNGSIVRKLMGHWHIDRDHAGEINRFYAGYFNTYLNYHRPCGFATITVDERGKRHRKYKIYRTPYLAFLALKNPAQYLREGITLEDLKKTAMAHSANGFAKLMQSEKEKLFKNVLPKSAKAFKKGGLAK
jgi:transposase InsO family protein